MERVKTIDDYHAAACYGSGGPYLRPCIAVCLQALLDEMELSPLSVDQLPEFPGQLPVDKECWDFKHASPLLHWLHRMSPVDFQLCYQTAYELDEKLFNTNTNIVQDFMSAAEQFTALYNAVWAGA